MRLCLLLVWLYGCVGPDGSLGAGAPSAAGWSAIVVEIQGDFFLMDPDRTPVVLGQAVPSEAQICAAQAVASARVRVALPDGTSDGLECRVAGACASGLVVPSTFAGPRSLFERVKSAIKQSAKAEGQRFRPTISTGFWVEGVRYERKEGGSDDGGDAAPGWRLIVTGPDEP